MIRKAKRLIKANVSLVSLDEIDQTSGKRAINNETKYYGYFIPKSSLKSSEKGMLGDLYDNYSAKLILKKGLEITPNDTLVKITYSYDSSTIVEYYNILQTMNYGTSATIIYLSKGTEKL